MAENTRSFAGNRSCLPRRKIEIPRIAGRMRWSVFQIKRMPIGSGNTASEQAILGSKTKAEKNAFPGLHFTTLTAIKRWIFV